MPVKRLLLLCSLSVALFTPGAAPGARQKANPARARQLAKRAIKSMARAIEVYTSSGSLKGAVRHVGAVEEDVTALTYLLPPDNPLLNALEAARNNLTHAALVSGAVGRGRRVPDEEMEALSVICEEYGARPGRGGRLLTGGCVKLIMRQARKNQREAFSVASREGVYTP